MTDYIVVEIHEENVAFIVTDNAANHKVVGKMTELKKRFGGICHYLFPTSYLSLGCLSMTTREH